MEKSRGFTLIEILVVIAILSILTLSIGGNFVNSFIKGRDSKRKQDLESIAKALELYYYDLKAYPTALPGGGTPFINQSHTSVIYLQQMPYDPSTRNSYCYTTDTSGTYYKIYANLENSKDSKVFPTPADHPCSVTPYNYGIASTNITP